MPSARREGICFSNHSHRSYKAPIKTRPPRYQRLPPVPPTPSKSHTGKTPPKGDNGHRFVIGVTPHAWHSSLFDPHWTFKIRTLFGRCKCKSAKRGVSVHIARYSDFQRLVDACGMSDTITLPDRHWIPYLGKCMDSLDDAATRARAIERAIQPLFSRQNPHRDNIDSANWIDMCMTKA